VDTFHNFPFSIKRVSYNDIHNSKLFIITFITISLLLLILTLQHKHFYFCTISSKSEKKFKLVIYKILICKKY
jgi:hypothetical protein